jgi:hypothetical protein
MNNELEVKSSVFDQLRASYPQHAEDNYQKNYLPQIRFKAKAVLDDNDVVVTKAGTFVNVVRSEDKNAEGKNEYVEEVIGSKLENVSNVFERYKLSFYDGVNNTYVASPLFDDKEQEVVKLFSGGKEIASGTAKELQELYMVEKDGKKKSELKLHKVLYIVVDGVLHEMALSVGNGYAWAEFKRNCQVALIKFTIDSKKTEFGGNKYNEMVFTAGEYLTEEEALANLKLIQDIKTGIAAEKAYFGQVTATAPAMTVIPVGDDF